MKKYILALLFALATGAQAQSFIARNGGDSVLLTKNECAAAVVQKHPTAAGLNAAAVRLGGKDHVACWRVVQAEIFLFYADGDQGSVPLSEFRLQHGV